jgi:hypothetical protein
MEPASGTYTYTITCGSGTRTASSQLTLTVLPSVAYLYADADNMRVGQTAVIQWGLTGLPCQATGGASGDGWAGLDVAKGGSLMLTETVPGTYVYNVDCGPPADHASAQLTLNFTGAAPTVTLTASPSQSLVVGAFTTLYWNGNIRPCSLVVAGPEPGNIYTDGRPQSSVMTGVDLIGSYDYTVTCGVGAQAASASLNLVFGGTPQVSFASALGAILAGTGNGIAYQTNILPCVASGGSPGDGWAGTRTNRYELINVTEMQAGTYTYTVTCGSGSQTAQAQLTVVVVGTAPAVTFAVDNPTPLYGQPFVLSWVSNAAACTATGGQAGDGWTGTLPGTGSKTLTEAVTGEMDFYIECGAPLSASARVSVTYAAYPAPDLRVSTTSAVSGQPITLTWRSADGSPCQASLGVAGDGWAGNVVAAGSITLTEMVTGGVDYELHCGVSIYADVTVIFQAPPAVPPPLPVGVQLAVSPSSQIVGQVVTLTWAVQNADACTAGGGGSGDTWQGNLSAGGGSQQVEEKQAGQFTFNITCSAGTANAASQASVTYSAAPAAGGGGGGGGGGALSWLDLLLIAAYGFLVRTSAGINIVRAATARLRRR